MDGDLASLHEKIDLLTATVDEQRQRLEALESSTNGHLMAKLDYLVAQAKDQRRFQDEMEELKRDIVPIANHMIKLTIDELAEVGSEFQAEDLLFMLKRLLRDTRLIVDGLDRLESMAELFDETQLLSKQVSNQAVTTLDRMEQDGYFTFARGGMRIQKWTEVPLIWPDILPRMWWRVDWLKNARYKLPTPLEKHSLSLL